MVWLLYLDLILGYAFRYRFPLCENTHFSYLRNESQISQAGHGGRVQLRTSEGVSCAVLKEPTHGHHVGLREVLRETASEHAQATFPIKRSLPVFPIERGRRRVCLLQGGPSAIFWPCVFRLGPFSSASRFCRLFCGAGSSPFQPPTRRERRSYKRREWAVLISSQHTMITELRRRRLGRLAPKWQDVLSEYQLIGPESGLKRARSDDEDDQGAPIPRKKRSSYLDDALGKAVDVLKSFDRMEVDTSLKLSISSNDTTALEDLSNEEKTTMGILTKMVEFYYGENLETTLEEEKKRLLDKVLDVLSVVFSDRHHFRNGPIGWCLPIDEGCYYLSGVISSQSQYTSSSANLVYVTFWEKFLQAYGNHIFNLVPVSKFRSTDKRFISATYGDEIRLAAGTLAKYVLYATLSAGPVLPSMLVLIKALVALRLAAALLSPDILCRVGDELGEEVHLLLFPPFPTRENSQKDGAIELFVRNKQKSFMESYGYFFSRQVASLIVLIGFYRCILPRQTLTLGTMNENSPIIRAQKLALAHVVTGLLFEHMIRDKPNGVQRIENKLSRKILSFLFFRVIPCIAAGYGSDNTETGLLSYAMNYSKQNWMILYPLLVQMAQEYMDEEGDQKKKAKTLKNVVIQWIAESPLKLLKNVLEPDRVVLAVVALSFWNGSGNTDTMFTWGKLILSGLNTLKNFVQSILDSPGPIPLGGWLMYVYCQAYFLKGEISPELVNKFRDNEMLEFFATLYDTLERLRSSDNTTDAHIFRNSLQASTASCSSKLDQLSARTPSGFVGFRILFGNYALTALGYSPVTATTLMATELATIGIDGFLGKNYDSDNIELRPSQGGFFRFMGSMRLPVATRVATRSLLFGQQPKIRTYNCAEVSSHYESLASQLEAVGPIYNSTSFTIQSKREALELSEKIAAASGFFKKANENIVFTVSFRAEPALVPCNVVCWGIPDGVDIQCSYVSNASFYEGTSIDTIKTYRVDLVIRANNETVFPITFNVGFRFSDSYDIQFKEDPLAEEYGRVESAQYREARDVVRESLEDQIRSNSSIFKVRPKRGSGFQVITGYTTQFVRSEVSKALCRLSFGELSQASTDVVASEAMSGFFTERVFPAFLARLPASPDALPGGDTVVPLAVPPPASIKKARDVVLDAMSKVEISSFKFQALRIAGTKMNLQGANRYILGQKIGTAEKLRTALGHILNAISIDLADLFTDGTQELFLSGARALGPDPPASEDPLVAVNACAAMETEDGRNVLDTYFMAGKYENFIDFVKQEAFKTCGADFISRRILLLS